ncbi:MAG: hypothetical protein RMJ17_02965 [Candidatus Aenigmarchaeota archaeon]|nr:hypothetical protein [Candidatus Aenigmarchaeota archaeon]MDW8149528.1 hypothetical protein [Candidatus Aenigmarchaeota archaeon]
MKSSGIPVVATISVIIPKFCIISENERIKEANKIAIPIEVNQPLLEVANTDIKRVRGKTEERINIEISEYGGRTSFNSLERGG